MKDERGFCCDTCRKSYHKHGGAYRKLRGELRKMIEKEFGPIIAEIKELRGHVQAIIAASQLQPGPYAVAANPTAKLSPFQPRTTTPR
jgi:hypothetical protein